MTAKYWSFLFGRLRPASLAYQSLEAKIRVMPTLSGSHVQSRTGRRLRYWVTYDPVSDVKALFACVVSEPSKGMFGSLEGESCYDGSVPLGPDCVPVELAIRSRVLSFIERTEFGEWKPPPPTWPGWYGPYL